MTDARPRWSSQTKILVIVLILVVLGYVLFKFKSAIAPVVLSIILAYVLAPLVGWMERRWRIKRGLAVLLTYLLVLGVVGGLAAAVTPLLAPQFRGVLTDIDLFIQQLVQLAGQQYTIFGFVIDGSQILGELLPTIRGFIEPLFGQSLDLVAGVLSSFVWIIFIIIISIYLVKDSRKVGAWFLGLVPPGYEQDAVRLAKDINTIWSAFFRGQLILALVMTGIITVEGLIVGLPFALAMGVLAGLMEFLPSIGHGIWITIAGALALFVGSTWLPIPNWLFLVLMIILHVVVTQFDLNYLIPRIIGRSVHLPPLVVILGIVAGAALAGVLGVVLAAPTIASLRVIGRYVYAHLIDVNPFPEENVAPPLPPPNPRFWQRNPGATRDLKDFIDDNLSSDAG
ncbi:MAG: AI-2E family transporter [Anaerolineae bacterium]|nr:AI-2E family transporter [Anaerolineae bacterium]